MNGESLMDYDETFVFRSYNANIPHLNTWIDDLIALTESSLPSTSYPSTEQLVQSLKRYDTIFCELIRHNRIFSEKNSVLFAKTWKGAFTMLNYIIKTYHRYVKHTQHLQGQAQQLLSERLASLAANKVKEEEFELERAALRCRIRNLEAEIESLKASNRSLDREYARSRVLIHTYIKNDELNERAWDLIEDLSSDLVDIPYTNQQNSTSNLYEYDKSLQGTHMSKLLGFKRKEVVDIGRQLNRQLNRIDIEMNGILTSIEQEENRQSLLINDLVTLVSRHQDVFGKGKWINNHYHAGETNSVMTKDAEIQVDMKDRHGVVEDLTTGISPDELASEIAALPMPPKVPPAISTQAISNRIKGVEYPYQLRKLMKVFPRVLRIPPIVWTCETIMAIYAHLLVQDTKSSLGIRQDIISSSVCYATYRYFHDNIPVASAADIQLAQFLRACEYHISGSKRVALFCNQLGIGEKDKYPKYDKRDTRLIVNIISRCYNDETFNDIINHNQGNFSSESVPPPRIGTIAAVSANNTDSNTLLPQNSLRSLNRSNLPSRSGSPVFNTKSNLTTPSTSRPTTQQSNFGTSARRLQLPTLQHSQMKAIGKISEQYDEDLLSVNSTADSQRNSRLRQVFRVVPTVCPDVPRIVAVNVAQAIFSKLLPNGSLDLMIRVNSLPSSFTGQDFVYIDDVIDLMMEAWKPVRSHLEEHAKYLFHNFSGVYRIVSESQFASDTIVNGLLTNDCDCSVVQIPRSLAQDMPRRPLRIFQKLRRITEDDDPTENGNALINVLTNNQTKGSRNTKDSKKKIAPVKKESVCELMNFNSFYDSMRVLIPSISPDQATILFNEGCDLSQHTLLKLLEKMWVRLVDDTDSGTKKRNDINVAAMNAASAAMKRAIAGEDVPQESDTASDDASQTSYDNVLKRLHDHFTAQTNAMTTEIESDAPLRLATHRDYYLNVETGQTQWMVPYRPSTFAFNDLEIDAFVSVVIHNDLLLKCPLRQTILITQPKDLWLNVDVHYKQIESRDGNASDDGSSIGERPRMIRKGSESSVRSRHRRRRSSMDELPSLTLESSTPTSTSTAGKGAIKNPLKKGKKRKTKSVKPE